MAPFWAKQLDSIVSGSIDQITRKQVAINLNIECIYTMRRRITKDQISGPVQIADSVEGGIVPFSAGRFEVSVSLVGTPADPREVNTPKTTLTMLKMKVYINISS